MGEYRSYITDTKVFNMNKMNRQEYRGLHTFRLAKGFWHYRSKTSVKTLIAKLHCAGFNGISLDLLHSKLLTQWYHFIKKTHKMQCPTGLHIRPPFFSSFMSMISLIISRTWILFFMLTALPFIWEVVVYTVNDTMSQAVIITFTYLV